MLTCITTHVNPDDAIVVSDVGKRVAVEIGGLLEKVALLCDVTTLRRLHTALGIYLRGSDVRTIQPAPATAVVQEGGAR